MMLIFIIFVSKYKPMYKVTLNGEEIGYVASKKNLEETLNNYINPADTRIAFVDVPNKPEYKLSLMPWSTGVSTDVVLSKIKEESTITYRLFAIKLKGENKQYVSTVEEAETVVAELKEEFKGVLDLEIGVEEVFTTDLKSVKDIGNVQVAKNNLDTEIISNCDSIINGVILSTPVSGTVTSRFGSRWGRQHSGLDIGAASGVPIYSCSKGTVKYTGWYYGYGNLVMIDHGNGIVTYYGHCSKICVSVGDEVTKDTVIALVGSTGNSTGPHLHLEIRRNGIVQNPQNYLYK